VEAGSTRDELDAGGLKGALKLLHRFELGSDGPIHRFNAAHGADRDTCCLGELLLPPPQHRTCGSELVSQQQSHWR
jgi:hypothetical protein